MCGFSSRIATVRSFGPSVAILYWWSGLTIAIIYSITMESCCYRWSGFHLGYFCQGGCKYNNYKIKGWGAKTTLLFQVLLPSTKNDVLLIKLLIIRVVWGYAPLGKLFNVSTSETVSGGCWALGCGKAYQYNIHRLPSILSQMLQGCGMCFLLRVIRRFS